MKKFLVSSILTLCVCFNSFAVLTGRTLSETVNMVHEECIAIESTIVLLDVVAAENFEKFHEELSTIESQLHSNAVMLFSQEDYYIFGKAYSATRAREIVVKFREFVKPVYEWQATCEFELNRLTELRKVISDIPDSKLTQEARRKKKQTIEVLESYTLKIQEWLNFCLSEEKRIDHVRAIADKLEKVSAKSFEEIHTHVFLAKDTPFFYILKDWKNEVAMLDYDGTSFFNPSVYGHQYANEWAKIGNLIRYGYILSYIIGALLGIGLAFWIRRKGIRLCSFKRSLFIGYTFGIVTMFATAIVLNLFFVQNPYYVSLQRLAYEFFALCLAINISIILLVRTSELISTFVTYLPMVFITLITFVLRNSLVSSYVLRVSIVPTFMLATTALIVTLIINRNRVRKLHMVSLIATAVVYVGAIICGWMGRYFLAFQIVVIWNVLYVGHLALSCIYFILDTIDERQSAKHVGFHGQWMSITVNQLFKPIIVVATFVVCVFVSAHMFDIIDLVEHLAKVRFIDIPDRISVSVDKIMLVISLGIIAHYVISVVRSLLKVTDEKSDKKRFSVGMSLQLITILMWLCFGIAALVVFEVNSTGVIAILSGVMVGVGIALRDTLDCFFCGLTMMAGRVKVGDFVECDGKRGWVRDIQYRTTLIQTIDGAMVSFFNTAFFGKGYRNLSGAKSKLERMELHFKMQKDADVKEFRKLFLEDIKLNVPKVAQDPAPKIHFIASDRFFVELMAEVWLPTEEFIEVSGAVKETLFYSLKDRGYSNMMEDTRTRVVRFENASTEKDI